MANRPRVRLTTQEIDQKAKEQDLSWRKKRRLNKQVIKEGITLGMIRSWRGLKGTQRHFGCNSKQELSERVSDEVIADYILERLKERKRKEQLDMAISDEPIILDTEEVMAEVDARLRRYLKAFDAPTPNDEEALRHLAFMEVRLAKIRELLAPFILTKTPEAIRIKEALTKEETAILKEKREWEKLLQIDRRGREEARGARKADEVIQELIDDARDFLKEEILEVKHCGILLAWIWHGFPTHPFDPFTIPCPRCGKKVWVSYPEKWKEKALRAADMPIDTELLDTMAKRGLFEELSPGGEEGGVDADTGTPDQ